MEKRDRITIDISGLRERLTQWYKVRNLSMNSRINFFLEVSLELYESLTSRGISPPHPGNVSIWLDLNLKIPDKKAFVRDTLSDYPLRQVNELTEISIERLTMLLNGAEPSEIEKESLLKVQQEYPSPHS